MEEVEDIEESLRRRAKIRRRRQVLIMVMLFGDGIGALGIVLGFIEEIDWYTAILMSAIGWSVAVVAWIKVVTEIRRTVN